VIQAANALGFNIKARAAVDLDAEALAVYDYNFKADTTINKNIGNIVNFHLWTEKGKMIFDNKPKLSGGLGLFEGKTDIVIGGPPCQGHSGFNNHTRGEDARHRLYYTVPAVGIALSASLIIIENVARILNDKHRVVDHATTILEDAGYKVCTMVCGAEQHGVAQSRKRHFLVASKHSTPLCNEVRDALTITPPSVYDAIKDLEGISDRSSGFDQISNLSAENIERINFLFDNGLYELPNSERPDCHKDGHTYPSVYGRLRPDSVANTITTGFLSPGRGRYIHPTQPRCLSPVEAARIQGFPDDYFPIHDLVPEIRRMELAKWIGDAVPPILGFYAGVVALLSIRIDEQNE
jgi:DNA (cytosine-5)-methyltransferase 1